MSDFLFVHFAMICLTSSSCTAPQGVICSIWTHGTPTHTATNSKQSSKIQYFQDILSFIALTLFALLKSTTFFHLCFRPPDRRRRDVFGVANNTLFNEGAGRGNTTFGPGDNSTDGIPPIKEYPFLEDKSTAEYLEILTLRPFTVYRIDIHACNEEVGRCSAGAFVFSRTKPAGEKPTWIKSVMKMMLTHPYITVLFVFPSQSR